LEKIEGGVRPSFNLEMRSKTLGGPRGSEASGKSGFGEKRVLTKTRSVEEERFRSVGGN